jgi:hypothetical protein
VAVAPPPLDIPVRRGFHFLAALRLWHLLSLDAPTVATLWSWSLASAVRVRLPWYTPLLLGLGTWLIYVADRILDGLRSGHHLRERHLFHARHRKAFLLASTIASFVLLWLVAETMNPAARREDAVLFTAILVYFCLIHLCRLRCVSGIERWLPKEAAVALVFACAVAVPAWSRLPDQRTMLIVPVTLFALVCWLNCIAIEKWEHSPRTAAHTSAPFPNITTRWARRHFFLLNCGIALLTIGACIQSLASGGPPARTAFYLACMISSALFLAFDRSRLNSLQLRIAADAALLTPLLFVIAHH